MTLQEILDAIAERYPHSFSNDNIIKKINIVLQQMYRTMYRSQAADVYDLFAENPFYPIEYSPETIIDVVVNGEEYPFQNVRYDSQERYYYIIEDNVLALYPTPTEDVVSGLVVLHYKEPETLTTDDLTVSPSFDSAWHMLIVYRICKDLAEIALDGNMVNVFAAAYNALETEYKRTKRSDPHQISDVYGGFNW
ncbi:phage adaptor protein [Paenibacillus silvisoli]|uniref:phage adaptor protein n=1 Tax=Paenibacillus silvisoli TaxID=3110539 RepID=UPI002805E389|nr:hypothetical protein [Paenibacillus silvisoli]